LGVFGRRGPGLSTPTFGAIGGGGGGRGGGGTLGAPYKKGFALEKKYR